MSTPLNATLAAAVNRRFFYGWAMVAVAGLGIFASGPGQSHTFSVFLQPISADLGVSQTGLASAYAMATLAAAFLLPLMGRQVDRFGPRLSLLGIAATLGVACMFFGAAANFLWLAVGFGLLRFFGQGSMMLGCANLVSQWFSARRGFAMSLMALGFGASMAVHPTLGQILIDAYGWRMAWVMLGVITWALMLPVIAVLVVNRPEDVGLLPDNERFEGDAEALARRAPTGLTLQEALRHPAFHIVAAGWFAIAMLVTTLHYHQFNILTLQGIDPSWAATSFSISAVTMVVAMPLVGRTLDRFPTRMVFAGGLIVQAISLTAVTLAREPAMVVLYAVIFGVNNSFSMTLFGYLWPRYFGRKHLGRIQGAGQMVGVVGASLGPLPVGFALDTFGDPTMSLRLLALIPLALAAVVYTMLRTPAQLTEESRLD